MTDDPRRFAPAAARNRDAILAVLRGVLPARGLVLEIASGSGEHCAHWAAALPALDFQPSDPDPANVASCDAWCDGLANVRKALAMDATAAWPVERADAVVCINMIHIAPWEAALGLLRGAALVLGPGAPLVIYGPWIREGVETAEGNLAFDADLRARNPEWGVRRLDDLAVAARGDFDAPAVIEMPANNVTVVLRRR
jgi:hypothetical protein